MCVCVCVCLGLLHTCSHSSSSFSLYPSLLLLSQSKSFLSSVASSFFLEILSECFLTLLFRVLVLSKYLVELKKLKVSCNKHDTSYMDNNDK